MDSSPGHKLAQLIRVQTTDHHRVHRLFRPAPTTELPKLIRQSVGRVIRVFGNVAAIDQKQPGYAFRPMRRQFQSNPRAHAVPDEDKVIETQMIGL